ncbi:site-specific integrase [Mesorhizobium sp. J428]|uniref:site-specific integrase n=1 Tax=Mesorhizobium sp. J428 TaxID=2898440 RepID=UPI00215121AE|nr:site-specific integrase [Mesorhizobium sp. J428]MCR5857217.1 site-specific integrase [Mesorhizobium sp. J428]
MAKEGSTRLTKTVVDAIPASSERRVVRDKELSGFGVRVEASGTKTFIIRYRANGGGRNAPKRFHSIGRYGNLTVDEARTQAKELLGAAAKSEDPAGDRQAKRREMLMADLIDIYEEEGCFIQRGIRQGQPMKPRTKSYTIARLRHHVVPLLGRKRVSEVGAGEIERFVRDVTSGKTTKDVKVGFRKRIIVRGGEGAARKVVKDLSAVFSFAVRRKIVPANPCDIAAVRKSDNRRDRYLTIDEISRLGKAFDAPEQEGANVKALNIARLWALTGCRRDEIAALRWGEVDFGRGLLILDDSKTGKSLRPLGAAAVAPLDSIGKRPGSGFVFPAERGDGHYQGTKGVWTKVVAQAGLAGVTPHTLRHTMGSTAVSTGEALALTGAILGHANMRSTAIYAHMQNNPSRRAASRVSRKIAAALAGATKGSARREESTSPSLQLIEGSVEAKAA